MWSPSFPTRDRTHDLCSGSMSPNHQGSPLFLFFKKKETHKNVLMIPELYSHLYNGAVWEVCNLQKEGDRNILKRWGRLHRGQVWSSLDPECLAPSPRVASRPRLTELFWQSPLHSHSPAWSQAAGRQGLFSSPALEWHMTLTLGICCSPPTALTQGRWHRTFPWLLSDSQGRDVRLSTRIAAGLGPESSSNTGQHGGGGDTGLQRRQGRLLTMLPIISIWPRWASVSHLLLWCSWGSCDVQTLKNGHDAMSIN